MSSITIMIEFTRKPRFQKETREFFILSLQLFGSKTDSLCVVKICFWEVNRRKYLVVSNVQAIYPTLLAGYSARVTRQPQPRRSWPAGWAPLIREPADNPFQQLPLISIVHCASNPQAEPPVQPTNRRIPASIQQTDLPSHIR